MSDYGRKIVIDLAFEDTLGEVSRAIREEGLHTLARIDVREHFHSDLAHELRQYMLVQAWYPQAAIETVQRDLDAAAFLPATFAVYELADGETAVLATEPFGQVASDSGWRQDVSPLAALADRESTRVARVLARLERNVAARRAAVDAA